MGGVVADRAFSHGLSASDGVISYVSWAAPHDGSGAARAIEVVRSVTDIGVAREGLLRLGMEPDSNAVRDLARAHAPRPPQGVTRLDLREATDVLVTAGDARDPAVPSRILTGAGEGHGGILNDPTAIDLTVSTIMSRRVPPDDRGRVLAAAADRFSDGVGTAVLIALCVACAAACVGGVLLRTPFGRPLDAALRRVPRATRRRCP
jgi:hypothetical protein